MSVPGVSSDPDYLAASISAGIQQNQQQLAAQQAQTSLNPQQQQIYDYMNPGGPQYNSSAGSLDPYSTNINANYTGAQTANPLQPSYLSTPTQGQATTAQAAQLGQGVNQNLVNQFSGQNTLGQLQQLSGGNLAGQVGPQAAEQQLMAAYQPAAAQSTANLNSQLASMGINGGAAVTAQNQLQGQLTSGLGQSLASLISGGQQNQLSLNSQNAGVLQNGQANQLGLYNTQAGLNQQTGLANQSAMNTMTGQNLSNMYNANQYNATAANDANGAYATALQNAYTTNLNNFQSMNTAGYTGQADLAGSQMTGSQNLAGSVANNFPVQSGAANAFSNLGSSLGSSSSGSSSPSYYGTDSSQQGTDIGSYPA